MGRHNRGRAAQWDSMARVEELESDEEEADEAEYQRELVRSGRLPYMRQLEYGGRGARRRLADHDEMNDETQSVVDGADYDLYDHGDSTVSYAVQLAMRDKEDQLVEKALERIRRAQMMGKKNVKLSQRELDALERKRLQTDGTRRPKNSKNPALPAAGRPNSRRNTVVAPPEQPTGYPPFAPDAQGMWPWGAGAAHGRPTSSSSAPRPRTPTTHSLRPQQSNSPLRPTYPPYLSNGRSQSMPQHHMYARPLPDDPQWAPPYFNPASMDPYAADVPQYPPSVPSDLRVGPRNRTSYPPDYHSHHRASMDGRQSRGARPAPSETESEESSSEEEGEEEETPSSDEEEEEEEDEVQVVKVVERRGPSGFQRPVSGNRRGRGRRAGR
ncbi:hypothetical protein N7474_003921 [Penicillium riverlandense]|uniref:uncharacterized protein n=1 Tax=Penicillium riverlandense TaxID=1903569 RepID=UPI002547507F|nr:uncharacterized protein N7474_003921 [Penicillium riverlandense]KAJ5818330.1 hypothetical protein N7474_003921 [Penicillium riverlandense]